MKKILFTLFGIFLLSTFYFLSALPTGRLSIFSPPPALACDCDYPTEDASCASGITICSGSKDAEGICRWDDGCSICNCYEPPVPPPECTDGETKTICNDSTDCSTCDGGVECSSCGGTGDYYVCSGGRWGDPSRVCASKCTPQICTPYTYKYECPWESDAPYGFCDFDHGFYNDPPYDPPYKERWREEWGWGKLYQCNSCGTAWVFRQEECTNEIENAALGRVWASDRTCIPPVPQVTPWIFSLQPSVDYFNTYVEGKVHSGTRAVGCSTVVDQTDPNSYGALAVLIPAGGPNHELRVNFVKTRGQYDVCLADGKTKKAIQIWNECTGDGDLNKWEKYISDLDECPEWGFVPTTWRQLASEPTPHVQARVGYYLEEESPLVMTWTEGFFQTVWEWFKRAWVDHLIYYVCDRRELWFLGINCPEYDEKKTPQTYNLSLQNPATSDWTSLKPNVPQEASAGARVLQQFFLPQDFPLGELPKGNVNCLTVPPPNDWTKCQCTYGSECDANGDGIKDDGQQACWGVWRGGTCKWDGSYPEEDRCVAGWYGGELVGCGPCITIGSIDREGCNSYFDLSDPLTNTLLYQTGQATQYAAVEGGFFQIFHPFSITPTPAFCAEDNPSPREDCASKFYYNVADPKSSRFPRDTYYTDIPDEETRSSTRPEEDRPLKLRTEMNFFKKGIWPAGIPLPDISL